MKPLLSMSSDSDLVNGRVGDPAMTMTSVRPPFLARYVYHHPYPLDESAMNRAAGEVAGEHDFTSFAASSGSEEDDHDRNMIRVVHSSELLRQPDGGEIAYVVRGTSFLRYMVRKFVGTLLEVGKGTLAPADIPKIFELRDRTRCGPTVPPEGLYLVSLEYPDPTDSLATSSRRSAGHAPGG